MNKNNYFITYNYHPEFVGVGKYSYEIVSELNKKHNEFNVITTDPHYPNKEIYNKSETSNNALRMTVFFGNSFFSRVINYFRFIFFVKKNINFSKAKLIVLVVPSISPLFLLISKKKKFGFKLVVYFQDIETNFFSKFNLLNSFINYFFIQKCNKCDEIITISNGMKNFLKKYTNTKINLIYNWFSDSNINLLSRKNLCENINISEEFNYVTISLNYGKKLNYILIKKIFDYYSNTDSIKFLLVGSGKFKLKFQKELLNEGIVKNVIFLDHLNIQNYLSLIRHSTCNLIVNMPDLDNTVYPSRLTSILGVGGKVIFIDGMSSDFAHFTSLYPNIGICIKGDLISISKAIDKYHNNHDKLNNDAIRFSNEYLNKKKSIKILERIFFENESIR